MTPRISVIIPVYNVERYVKRALESILAQTFPDFECLVINDGSTDGTRDLLGSFADRRLRIVDNRRNVGYVLTLNRGLALARGEFIARMDGDDASLPGRFAAQIRFLDDHPEVGVCGMALETMGHRAGAIWRPPCGHEDIVCNSFFESTLYHPSIMLRRKVLEASGIVYDNSFYGAEDFHMWVQLSRLTRLANLPEVGLLYNRHETQVSRSQRFIQTDSADRVRYRQLIELSPMATETDHRIHNLIGSRNQQGIGGRRREARRWLLTLPLLNQGRQLFPEPHFTNCVQRKTRWVEAHSPSLWVRVRQKFKRVSRSIQLRAR